MKADLLRDCFALFSNTDGSFKTLSAGTYRLHADDQEGFLLSDYEKMSATIELKDIAGADLGVRLRVLHRQMFVSVPPYKWVRSGQQATMRQSGEYVFEGNIKAPMLSFELEVLSPTVQIRAFLNVR